MSGISTKIRRERLIKGFKPEEMAEKLHLSKRAYQNIENGTTKLDIERLNSIAEALGIPIMDLINASNEGVYIQVNHGGPSYSPIEHYTNNHNKEETSLALIDKLIAEKDQQIKLLREELKATKTQLDELIAKITSKL